MEKYTKFKKVGMAMEIKRDFYLDKLIKRKNNGRIKVITGIRGCGKSYLMNQIFYNHLLESGVDAGHIIRFDFDSTEAIRLIRENSKNFAAYIHSRITDEGMYYLLLDEVQMMDGFEDVLNGYLYCANVDVYVTGSNLSGYNGDEIRMYPLSFAEFMSVYRGDKYTGLSEYMFYGGMPLVVLREAPAEKTAVLQNLYREIYTRDIMGRNRVKNTRELEELLYMLSSTVGSLTNPEKLMKNFRTAKKSKITSATIKKYLGYFEDSFLIEPAGRYDIKRKAQIETPKKYYFTDPGLMNAGLKFRRIEQANSMDNIIYNELRMRGYSVDVGVVSVVERNKEGRTARKQQEVDFVCHSGATRCYIRSAYSLPDEVKRTQTIEPFRKIDDSFKKIIVTGDIVRPYYDDYGILTVNIYDFLLDPNFLSP